MDHRGRLLGSIDRDRRTHPAATAAARASNFDFVPAFTSKPFFPRILSGGAGAAPRPIASLTDDFHPIGQAHWPDAHAGAATGGKGRKRVVRRALATCLVMAGAILAGGPSLGLRLPSSALASALSTVDSWLSSKGFGIDQVSLEGYRYTSDADIFDALDLSHAGSMLLFNGTEAAAKILNLPWVQRVQIIPQVPNGLHVVISERTPFAVWEQPVGASGRMRRTLVDQSGRVLVQTGDASFANLPRIKGEGAPAAAADLYATLSLFPAIAGRLQMAERVGGRRWVLALDRGLRIDLPAQQEAAALQTLAVLQARHGLMDRDLEEIDLREPGLTVRPRVSPVVTGSTAAVPLVSDAPHL